MMPAAPPRQWRVTSTPSPAARLPDDLTVLERGWLSSNNVILHASASEAGATLVDASHVNHAEQTVALVRHALSRRGERLVRVVNTHLHSDHCGGNAAVQAAFDVPVWIPPGQADAVRAWDRASLSHEQTGQRCDRFTIDGVLEPGNVFAAGGRAWQVLAAPGHDPHAVMLFDPRDGVLISGDALWRDGFGVVFPETVGEPGFDDVGAVLDLIDTLPVRVVIPGHGAPFADVADALARARSRLAAWRNDPARHARHAAKVFIKYRLMEEREQPLATLCDWASATPMMRGLWERHAPPGADSPQAWAGQLVADLARSGAVTVDGQTVRDA